MSKNFKPKNPDTESVKKSRYYEVLVFNHEDTNYALYTRRTLMEAQLLAMEKLECPQVSRVQVNEVVKWQTTVWAEPRSKAA